MVKVQTCVIAWLKGERAKVLLLPLNGLGKTLARVEIQSDMLFL